MKEKKNISLNEKLDLILKNQKKILSNEKKILDEEHKIEDLEELELEKEDKTFQSEEEALKELMKLEKNMSKGFNKPMTKITKRDMFKGFIGAFIAILGHFAFMKAFDISKDLTYARASVFYVVAFMMIIIMLYYTGFKKVKQKLILKIMPLRAMILYFVSIVAIIILNLLFGKIDFPIDFGQIYKLISASIILAVIGAGTADLIGTVE